MLKHLREFFQRISSSVTTVEPEFDPQLFIYVKIPGDIQPLIRGKKFEDPVERALQTAKLGHVSGGGSQLSDPHPNGSSRVEFCGLDIDTTDLNSARNLLMHELLRLNAPQGTEIQYRHGELMLLDRLTDGVWKEGLPRITTHPAFGW